MKSYLRSLAVVASILVLTGCSRPSAADVIGGDGEYDLVGSMSSIQRWLDKLGRAAAANNWPLANFYLHELEEATVELAGAGVVYHDQPVSQLTQSMLVPAVESLEGALEDRALFSTRVNELVRTCNACHAATQFGFIQITLPDLTTNPWNQDFSPAP